MAFFAFWAPFALLLFEAKDYPETLVSAFFVVALTFAGPKMDLKKNPINASGFTTDLLSFCWF